MVVVQWMSSCWVRGNVFSFASFSGVQPLAWSTRYSIQCGLCTRLYDSGPNRLHFHEMFRGKERKQTKTIARKLVSTWRQIIRGAVAAMFKNKHARANLAQEKRWRLRSRCWMRNTSGIKSSPLGWRVQTVCTWSIKGLFCFKTWNSLN